MEEKEKELKELEAELTGDMWEDMELMEKIHRIKSEMRGQIEVCNLDDDECLSCGS